MASTPKTALSYQACDTYEGKKNEDWKERDYWFKSFLVQSIRSNHKNKHCFGRTIKKEGNKYKQQEQRREASQKQYTGFLSVRSNSSLGGVKKSVEGGG